MNVIIEEYKNTPDDKKCINTLSKKYKVKNETIKKYLDQAGVEVIKNIMKNSNTFISNCI